MDILFLGKLGRWSWVWMILVWVMEQFSLFILFCYFIPGQVFYWMNSLISACRAGGVTEKKKAEELCSLLGVDGILSPSTCWQEGCRSFRCKGSWRSMSNTKVHITFEHARSQKFKKGLLYPLTLWEGRHSLHCMCCFLFYDVKERNSSLDSKASHTVCFDFNTGHLFSHSGTILRHIFQI